MDRVPFFNFDSWTEVHDTAWLIASSGLQRGTKIILPRNDEAGPNYLELAPGEGRNGGTAIRMVLTDVSGRGSPDFWGLLYDKNSATAGSLYDNPYYPDGYTVPIGKRANRIHFWIKFPSGYRQSDAANPSTTQNYHFGTYHFDPALINGTTYNVVESNGWHHYHQIVIRHDLAQNDWVHVCLNPTCTHMRTYNTQIPATNNTVHVGNYMETLTRWYFAPVLYTYQGGSSEMSAPFEVLIDSVYTEYVEEYLPIDIQIENWENGQIIDASGAATSPRWNVQCTNTTSNTVSGVIVTRDIQSASNLYIPGTSTSVRNTVITFTPNEVKNYELQFTTASSFSTARSTDVVEIEVYNATGGTFTITGTSHLGEGPYTTAAIAYDASPAAVESALEAAFLVGTGFTVTGSAGRYRIERSSSGSWRNWIVSSTSSLTGTNAAVCLKFSSSTLPISIDFIASTEEINGRYGTKVASKADARVTYDSSLKGSYLGPPDADVCTTAMVAQFWERTPPVAYKYSPYTIDGGKTTRGSKNATCNKQLHYNDLNGSLVSFELIDFRTRSDTSHTWALNTGSLSLSSGGLLSFTPDADWTGIVLVRFRMTNSVGRTSRDFAHFMRITPSSRMAVGGGKFYKVGSNLVTMQ